ncbi:MAG: hypothetical protein IPI65_15590 [Bacteroidetes bacterium]|nr:hypothetical protein [Bacteroidota bacterium]
MLIRPGENIAIQSTVRIRNDFGGFWGSGVTFDVRGIICKRVIKDIVRCEVVDVHYKLTPYTFIIPTARITNINLTNFAFIGPDCIR